MMKMKKYRIVGELADNRQSITKFKKKIKKALEEQLWKQPKLYTKNGKL